METIAETKKRKGNDQEEKCKRKMSNGADTIAYLQQRYKVQSELKKEELKMKQEELNESRARFVCHTTKRLNYCTKGYNFCSTKTTRTVHATDACAKCCTYSTDAKNCQQ
jgi:hypothetical protein